MQRSSTPLPQSSKFLHLYTEPVEGNIVAVGDTAAFIETYCQSAMMYGYRAAKAILNVLATGKGYDEYTNFWRESFEYCWPGEIEKACADSDSAS